MGPHTKEKLIEEYREAMDAIPQEALELDLRITIKTMQAIAEGKPISPTQLADIWEMPLQQVLSILEQAEANGNVEIDAQGDLVGGILTLNSTPHEVSMGNKHLYAWCAWDAMYAPGVVGKLAHIVSKDPVTGERIRITVDPAGVEKVQPKSAVVSIVGPASDMRAGPESARCAQMLFFGSRQSAERWNQNRDGVSILTVEEVFDVTKEIMVEPARRLGLVAELAE